MTYDAAVKALPGALIGSYDPRSHLTVAALLRMAQHEIDLWNEGEETDIRSAREANAVRRYMAQLSPGSPARPVREADERSRKRGAAPRETIPSPVGRETQRLGAR